MHRVFQGAVPDVAYTDPGHGRETIVELKFINPGPTRYGREPTIQQRAWLVSKVRSDIAMMATKLNAQVIIKNLQNMHEKSLPPTGAAARRRMELEYQDWARLQGRGPRTGGPFDRTIGWRSW